MSVGERPLVHRIGVRVQRQIATALNGRVDQRGLQSRRGDRSSSAVATVPSASMRSSISITSRRSTTGAGFW